MKKVPLILLMCLLPSIAAAYDYPRLLPPFATYSYHCNDIPWQHTPLIYESAFPDAHPGISILRRIELHAFLNAIPWRREAELTVVLFNRRGNRPAGFKQLLMRLVTEETATSSAVIVPPIRLVEGDMIKVEIHCKFPGVTQTYGWPHIRYAIDFYGR